MELVIDAGLQLFVIAAAALVYYTISSYILTKTGSKQRIKEIQDEMNRINNRAIEAAKPNASESVKKEAEDLQAKMPELLKESMIVQFKPIIFTLPVFFVLIWLLKFAFPYFVVVLPFKLPIFIYNIQNFPNWRDTFGVTGWFILVTFFGGLALQYIAGVFEKARKK